MSVEDNESRIQYKASNGQVKFSFPFVLPIAATGDINLKVYYTAPGDDPNLNTDLLVENTDYTVVGRGIDPTPSTRNINLTTASFPTGAAENAIITIIRDMPYDRTTDFKTNGDFTAQDLNNQFDRIILMVQQLNTQMQQQGLLYNENDILLANRKDNILPPLADNTGDGVPVWTTNSNGELIAAKLTSSESDTLRSELLNNQNGSDGAGIIGYYNTTTDTPTTVRAALNALNANPATTTFVTGMMIPTYNITPNSGWILADDNTIGGALSNATNRANADTQTLFELIWNQSTSSPQLENFPIYDSSGAVVVRGATATDDFNANHQLSLGMFSGRSIANAGQSTLSKTFTATADSPGVFTVDDTSHFYEGSIIQVSTTATLPSPLIVATDYYVHIVGGTTFNLAESAQDLINGTYITTSSTGSGTNTLTIQLTDRVLGDWTGEERHLLTTSELPSHTHMYGLAGGVEQKPAGAGIGVLHSVTQTESDPTGGSTYHNVMQPTVHMYWWIKL